jgi:hypothetical protein
MNYITDTIKATKATRSGGYGVLDEHYKRGMNYINDTIKRQFMDLRTQ